MEWMPGCGEVLSILNLTKAKKATLVSRFYGHLYILTFCNDSVNKNFFIEIVYTALYVETA